MGRLLSMLLGPEINAAKNWGEAGREIRSPSVDPKVRSAHELKVPIHGESPVLRTTLPCTERPKAAVCVGVIEGLVGAQG